MNELYSNSKRVETLKQRTKNCCCKYCGGNLVLKKIIFTDFGDARVEIFCEACDRIEFGVEKAIYASAQNFIDNLQVNFFDGMDDNQQRRRMNVARVCEIMAWGLKDMGYLGQAGFLVPAQKVDAIYNACTIIADERIPNKEE